MIKILSIIILLSFPVFLYIYFRSLKKVKNKMQPITPIETQERVETIKIIKNNPSQSQITNDLLVDISTIIKRDEYYDFLLTFDNYLGKHIRIALEEIKLITNQHQDGIIGDFSFQDLTLGTNDYILKNTIIDGGNLIRNVHFKTTENIIFNGDESIIIQLKVNNEPYEINTSVNASTVKEIRIIREK